MTLSNLVDRGAIYRIYFKIMNKTSRTDRAVQEFMERVSNPTCKAKRDAAMFRTDLSRITAGIYVSKTIDSSLEGALQDQAKVAFNTARHTGKDYVPIHIPYHAEKAPIKPPEEISRKFKLRDLDFTVNLGILCITAVLMFWVLK